MRCSSSLSPLSLRSSRLTLPSLTLTIPLQLELFLLKSNLIFLSGRPISYPVAVAATKNTYQVCVRNSSAEPTIPETPEDASLSDNNHLSLSLSLFIFSSILFYFLTAYII